MKAIGSGIWYLPFKFPLLGVDIHRNVTVIRLTSGKLLIHSTANFSADDVAQIRALGEPAWITDPMIDHDTFAAAGAAAFPEASYLAPEGFPGIGRPVLPLMPPPEEWRDEIEVLPIEGAPGFGEHVFFHLPSRTLIVCDLLMNFPAATGLWKQCLLRVGLGKEHAPGTSRRMRFAVQDEEALRKSVRRVMEWEFEQVVVGHGEPLREHARERARRAFEVAGWL